MKLLIYDGIPCIELLVDFYRQKFGECGDNGNPLSSDLFDYIVQSLLEYTKVCILYGENEELHSWGERGLKRTIKFLDDHLVLIEHNLGI